MSQAKVSSTDYLDFLIATPRNASAMEAERTHPDVARPAAHDAYTRLLHRLEPDSATLWNDVHPQISGTTGSLILDDSVLDKPFARKMDLVHYHWSGKHHRVVKGIDLMTLLWTDGDRHLPCDYRLYDKPSDHKSKNDHFQDLLRVAKERGMQPECVLFDGWYSSLENLKLLKELQWRWLTRLKANRRVNPDRTGLRALSTVDIAATGTVVHLERYGLIKVFRIEAKDGTTEYWATNDLEMDDLLRLRFAEDSWKIEEYHRGLKQVTNVERCQCRAEVAQRNHIGLALRAFVVMEQWCFRNGVNWLKAKWSIVQDAVRNYRANPTFQATMIASA
jgi:putative transposase